MNASNPILIAYDGSEGSKAAIDAAGRLFPGHAAIVVSVWHSVAAATAGALIAIPSGVASRAYEELDKESERLASAKADEGAAAARAAGLDATGSARLAHGQVWVTLIDAAEHGDAQAIVVGSRGLSPVKSALLGSVASGLVHHSTRPVLVAPLASRPAPAT